MKKRYVKPAMNSVADESCIVPLAAAIAATELAPAAALVGAYAIGRGVKNAMKVTPGAYNKHLSPVLE